MAKQKRKTDSVAEPQAPEIGKGYHLPAGRYAEKLKRERRAKKIARYTEAEAKATGTFVPHGYELLKNLLDK